jgi:nucleoside-diphosphate-sugar epimerase
VSEANPLTLVQATLGEPLPALPPCDFIVHAASNASPKTHQANAVDTLTANFVGLRDLLAPSIAARGCRVLYFSSAEIYGSPCGQREAISETDYGRIDPLSPRAAYAVSKIAAEALAAAIAREKGLSITIARPFHSYGPGMRLNDGRIFADLVAAAIDGGELVIKGDGSPVRAYCYVTDATRGFLALLLDGSDGEAYNVGNPHQVFSIRELANLVMEIEPRCRLVMHGTPAQALSSTRDIFIPSISKLSALGWQPQVAAKDGFQRTIEHCRAAQRPDAHGVHGWGCLA